MAADPDFTKLTRQQKLAIFLIVLGPEPAAEIMRHLDDTDIELVCREMSQYTMISDALRSKVLEEFSPLIGESIAATMGGLDYARRALEIARGDYKAGSIIGRLGPAGTAVEVIKDISEMEGRQIYNLVKNEQPQTISFVLSYLDGAKSAEIFALLSPDLREEVIERLGTIDSTSLDLVSKIVRNLGKHFDNKVRPTYHRSGGVRAVADLLNGVDKEMSKNLLARLEERNAHLGAAIRKKMFSFEDLGRLQGSDLQRILREVDSANLAVSMKSASEPIKEKIFGAISKRAAESLRDEIGMLGPVRLKDVEVAQDAIIQVVRRLEEEGTISLGGEGDSAVVA
ncbi:flagellar motor switch protein FliG [Nibricoccus aquaticus]|uniref:Flagellar motor switch protein FliG n=1 Tax=Nibricoccus aquaticus TaxID=2576891 RepID=A0A290Q5A2_9BACT|nr:flagellar motor switch protein FliG [Nibricoccus aquaticus]ATC63674.1 flagellar motor switch protein FliG [Nibricoccus aquaticus]